jgi:anti-sigma B factor antagonist
MISIEKRDKVDIISFNVNRIDALITDEVRERITRVFDITNSKVIIDLKGVEYIDSSGFGCFLAAMRTARNNFGVLKFANPAPQIMELFRTLNLHTVFQIYDDIDVCFRTLR